MAFLKDEIECIDFIRSGTRHLFRFVYSGAQSVDSTDNELFTDRVYQRSWSTNRRRFGFRFRWGSRRQLQLLSWCFNAVLLHNCFIDEVAASDIPAENIL